MQTNARTPEDSSLEAFMLARTVANVKGRAVQNLRTSVLEVSK